MNDQLLRAIFSNMPTQIAPVQQQPQQFYTGMATQGTGSSSGAAPQQWQYPQGRGTLRELMGQFRSMNQRPQPMAQGGQMSPPPVAQTPVPQSPSYPSQGIPAPGSMIAPPITLGSLIGGGNRLPFMDRLHVNWH